MRPAARRARALGYWTLAVLALAGAGWLLWPASAEVPETVAEAGDAAARAAANAASADHARVALTARQRADATAAGAPADSIDLADVIPPGSPEPTMGEVIEGLHAAGIRSGLGAFNPPGTSPPLVGLAVPPDFPLPDGYVRHHQVTDDGQDIEPILMFHPDYEFVDGGGRAINVPPNRVVPPQWAPPGLPVRQVRIPPPRAQGGATS
jgi:hypothetical protein